MDFVKIRSIFPCSQSSTLPSGQQTQEPQNKARLWDDYIITNANIYPDLAAEAVSAMFVNMRNATEPTSYSSDERQLVIQEHLEMKEIKELRIAGKLTIHTTMRFDEVCG
ncbi:MAG: hypothetical protein IJ587_06555 [Synergistaceae bacterium]|nr:hypothetical protein [Synergistaceae bacterium]